MDYFPLITVSLVLAGTAFRSLLPKRAEIWLIMCAGAAAVLAFGAISPKDALMSVDFGVMAFLFFMFILGEVLEESGFLYVLEYKLFSSASNVSSLLLSIIFSMGLLSYFFMNDTIAVIAAPLMIFLSKKHSLDHRMLLLALAFSVTIGSVASPIGNPQNLLIASRSGMKEPFSVFAVHLLIPTVINLFAVYAVLRLFFRREFDKKRILSGERSDVEDYSFYRKASVSVFILAMLIILWILSRFFLNGRSVPLYAIPILPALWGLASSGKRAAGIMKRVDYKTLLFFVGMFILMKSLYLKQEPEILFSGAVKASNPPLIMLFSIAVSQIVSNVPFAALFLDLLKGNGANETFVSLAAGSTIAGNLFILGAASNVIIIQKAEREGRTLSFLDFSKCGIVLTAVNFLVYWLFLSLF